MAFVSLDFSPPPRTLRNFGLIGGVAFAGLAAVVHFKIGAFARMPAGFPARSIFLSLSAYCGICALAAPPALKWLYIALSVVGFPIGYVVSYIVVTVMFFIIIAPIGMLMRAFGRDAMKLKFDPQATTYWIKRRPPDTVKRYFRQF